MPFLKKTQDKYQITAQEIFTDDSGKYWGSEGAGGLFYAEDTKRLCFAKRSGQVNEPHTWGTWGGALDKGESPKDAVLREVREEAGYTGKLSLKEIFVFQDKNFRYTNFLITVPKEFNPKLDWENEDFDWVHIDQIPKPLHPGAKKLIPHLKEVLLVFRQENSVPV